MPNPNWTATERNNIFKRFGSLGKAAYHILLWVWYASRARVMVEEAFDENARLSTWTFTAGKLYDDTDESGKVYGKIVVNGGNWDIELYKESGRTTLVSKATAVAAGATGTLVAQTGYNLAGTVKLASSMAADTDWDLTLGFDAQRLWETIFNAADSDEKESNLKTQLKAEWLRQISNPSNNMLGIYRRIIEQFFFREFIAKELDLTGAQVAEGMHDVEYTDDASGRTLKRRKGILAYLNDAMQDNATAVTIKANTVTMGAITADADNSGVMAFIISSYEHLMSGDLTIECVDETVGSEKFRVSHRLDFKLPFNNREELEAATTLQAERILLDYPMGVQVTANRGAATETGDDGAIFSAHSATGMTSTNTDDGTIYIRIKRTNNVGPEFTIKAYKSTADRTADTNAIGTKVVTGTGSETTTLTGSGLTWTFTIDKTAAGVKLPVLNDEDIDINVNFEVCKKGDIWTRRIDNDYAGLFQTLCAFFWQASINSATSGGQNVNDDYCKVNELVYTNP